jgi:hypothetical protein
MKFNTAAMHNAAQHPIDVDEETFNRVDEEWEEGLRKYEERLKEIDHVLPESVKKFMATVHLHDADFDTWASIGGESGRLQFVIRQQDWGDWKFICVLRYKLPPPDYTATVTGSFKAVEMKINEGPGFYRPTFDPEKFSKVHIPHWLYDEWDHLGTVDGPLGQQEVFSHSFLLSNGAEFNIAFTEFEFLFVPIGEGFVEHGQ